ncbi:MAG: hypothetical protein PHD54_05515 [Desulfuromonadaceae bacterium]|nr:hypothetical protein [Desulfuromonadaceae bacterium]
MNNRTDEQFDAIVKKYKESTMVNCSEEELKRYQTFLLEQGARNGLNENTYYQLLGYIEKLLIVKNQEEHDAMMRAYRDVPLNHELEVMIDIDLAELQSQLPSDSPGKIIIENEWRRRRSNKEPNPATTPTDSKPPKTIENKECHQRPIGIAGIAIFAGIMVILAIYLIKKHFGIPL